MTALSVRIAPKTWVNVATLADASRAVRGYLDSNGLGFSGCYDTMNGASYAQAPTPQTAADECAKMQRKFWQRPPTDEEGKACVALAVDGLASEANARRCWAHVCASILASAGFTTY